MTSDNMPALLNAAYDAAADALHLNRHFVHGKSRARLPTLARRSAWMAVQAATGSQDRPIAEAAGVTRALISWSRETFLNEARVDPLAADSFDAALNAVKAFKE